MMSHFRIPLKQNHISEINRSTTGKSHLFTLSQLLASSKLSVGKRRQKLYIHHLNIKNDSLAVLKFLTFARTFSKEAGFTSEKQIKNTSVCGYERGLNLS